MQGRGVGTALDDAQFHPGTCLAGQQHDALEVVFPHRGKQLHKPMKVHIALSHVTNQIVVITAARLACAGGEVIAQLS